MNKRQKKKIFKRFIVTLQKTMIKTLGIPPKIMGMKRRPKY